MYWGWYIDKTIGDKAKIEIEIKSQGTQWLESLLHLIKKLELDK